MQLKDSFRTYFVCLYCLDRRKTLVEEILYNLNYLCSWKTLLYSACTVIVKSSWSGLFRPTQQTRGVCSIHVTSHVVRVVLRFTCCEISYQLCIVSFINTQPPPPSNLIVFLFVFCFNDLFCVITSTPWLFLLWTLCLSHISLLILSSLLIAWSTILCFWEQFCGAIGD